MKQLPLDLQELIDAAPKRGGKRPGQSGIERSISACVSRVGEAHYMGWAALEQSWQKDLDRLEAMKAAGRTATDPSVFNLQKKA